MAYRLGYDKVFIPTGLEFEYKGEIIQDLTVFFVYKVIDKRTGKEVLFSKDHYSSDDIEGHSLNDFFRCEYNAESDCRYVMIPTELHANSNYEVTYIKEEYSKCVNRESENISREEFIDIITSNEKLFDNGNNKPTQTLAFATVKAE